MQGIKKNTPKLFYNFSLDEYIPANNFYRILRDQLDLDFVRDQVFTTSMDQLVPEDSWARVVDLFVDVMPVLEFGFSNSRLNKEGNLPYHPADLFKLLLYGYRKGIRSANQLHEATRLYVE